MPMIFTMTVATTVLNICSRCSSPLPPGVMACPNCGLFVHLEELQGLSSQAMQLEQTNAVAAANIWRSALELLPADSPQYQMIRGRIAGLEQGASPVPLSYQSAPLTRSDPVATALFKTVGSMAVSIVVYAWYFGSWWFSAGFVVLMLVHELGHVIANRYYGIKASPPIFIPFMGAVINLRQRPQNAKAEAIIGIGGPVLGTIGAIVCYALYL